MSTLLRVDASFRTEGSISRAVADTATNAWLTEHPGGNVVHRSLGVEPIASDTWAQALGAAYTPQEQWSAEQRAAMEISRTLADEILEADVVVLASPLYNFGVSQYAKVWIDMLITDPRLGPGSTALENKPALLVVAQGGGYRAGTPRHGWDHATSYLERILADNFGMTVETVIADLTLAGVNPAMAHLTSAAEQALSDAHDSADQHGSRLAATARAAA